MIQLKEQDVWLLNSVGANVNDAQQVLQRMAAAQASLIQLLEKKYKAKFNPQSGQFEEIKKPEKE